MKLNVASGRLRQALAVCAILASVGAVALIGAQQSLPSAIGGGADRSAVLSPTSHPTVSRNLSQLWYVPGTADRARPQAEAVSAAMRAAAKGEYAKVIAPLSRPAAQQGMLGTYALYHLAVSHLRSGHGAEARTAFRQVQARQPVGYLSEAALLGEGESLELLNDDAGAMALYQRMLDAKLGAIDDVTFHLGRAARAAGQLQTALDAYIRVYYEFAGSELSPSAGAELATLSITPPVAPNTARFRYEVGRAERLFATKQYGPARAAFELVKPHARDDDKELVELRIAESNYFLKRARDAREGLKPYLKDGSRQGEALYFYAVASRDLGDIAEYIKNVRRIVADFPSQTWAEEALNNLASYYIVTDSDDQADEVFRDMYQRYPRGRYADRAAYKIGWRAYLKGSYNDTVRYFEQAAVDFPRSDYRPAWLYWSGRAHEALKESALANDRYLLAATDYLNTYYGRLAVTRMGGKVPALQTSVVDAPPPSRDDAAALEIPNASLVRALAAAGLFDDANAELRYAQRVWGDSPAIQATLAWISHEQGLTETGNRQFTLLRGAITTMRRAYPQFMAAGGERLPREILTIIFPLSFWDLIRQYSLVRGLDPYLVAALVAQESTFVRDVQSSASAVGLMQLMAPTARQYARKVGLRYTASLRSNADANVRMGTAYFADKIKQFGDVHLALASYNAGEAPVKKWLAERPGMPREEFIEDIPYAETQNYVKRILGTAEDYRRLYGR